MDQVKKIKEMEQQVSNVERKVTINEEQFIIEISEWNDFTLGLLKQYSDWKCNGKQTSVAPLLASPDIPVDIPTTIKKQYHNRRTKQLPVKVQDEIFSLYEKGKKPTFIFDAIVDKFGFDVSLSSIRKYGHNNKKNDSKKKLNI